MEYRCVTTLNEIQTYLGGADVIAFDFETSPTDAYRNEERAALDAHKAGITGVSFSVSEGTAIYVPFTHHMGRNVDNKDEVLSYLAEAVFTNKEIIKVAHNLAFESMFLYAQGIVVQEPCYDTIAASQLTIKSDTEFRKLSDSGLKLLAMSLFNAEMPDFLTVTDGRHFDEMNPQEYETIRYACADSDYTLRLYHKFNDWFDRYLPKHRYIVEKVESPTAVYCGLMKYNGLLMDKVAMLQKQAEAEKKITEIRGDIQSVIGEVDIGANAGTAAFKQYLFHDLGLPVLKTTAKNQDAADDEAMLLLTEWSRTNKPEFVHLFELVQEYRKWGKLKSTYIDGYLAYINSATGRIHPDLMPLGTETGRFAARNPNLQNCFDEQTEILTRRGFVLFKDLLQEDLVAQWDNGDIYFVKPQEYITRHHKGDMVYLKSQHTDLCMTPDHRCLLQDRRRRNYYVVRADEYSKDAKQLHAAQYAFGNKHLSKAEVVILTAAQADGSFNDGGVDFKLTKARKYRRLVNALRESNLVYSDNDSTCGHVRLYIYKESAAWLYELLGKEKVWGPWLLEYDRWTIKAILEELPHWDGCFTRGNMYSSSVKTNIDWMQIIYSLTGWRAHLRIYESNNVNAKLNYQLDVVDRDYSLTSEVNRTIVPYDGNVYCVTVPSGFIVVRRCGQISITGNCPRKDNDPVGVRSFIIAPKDSVLLSFDLSQIELRVGAFYCRDEKMLETYHNGGDIHAQTTSVIYGIPMEAAADKNAERYKERRTIAKNCNFGVFYGLFPSGLQKTLKFKAGLDAPMSVCEQIIKNLKNGYPKLTRWQKDIKHLTAHRFYAETSLGRRRYLPGIFSTDRGKRSFAERCAMNTPIQGTAADILKLVMGRIIKGIPVRPWLKPLLQIHDELVVEIPADKVYEAAVFIKECMEAQPFPEFDVPIIAEGSFGTDFGYMKEIV